MAGLGERKKQGMEYNIYRPTFRQLLLDKKRVARHLKSAVLFAVMFLIIGAYRNHAFDFSEAAIVFVVAFLVRHLFAAYLKLDAS